MAIKRMTVKEKRAALVKSLREKLKENGQTLKWWHKNNAEDICTYNYFLRQINDITLMRKEVARAIESFFKNS